MLRQPWYNQFARNTCSFASMKKYRVVPCPRLFPEWTRIRRLSVDRMISSSSAADERPMSDVWPIQFGDRLPPVPVPLLPGDADMLLDLQQALTNVYDLSRYDLAIDYSAPPDISLPADQWHGRKNAFAPRQGKSCLESAGIVGGESSPGRGR